MPPRERSHNVHATIELQITPPPGKAARNEQRKALAATCNTGSIAFLGSALLASGQSNPWLMLGGLVGFIALQGGVHYILNGVED